jgi:hydroxyethylthiazole kinase-like sugar kinase family protein
VLAGQRAQWAPQVATTQAATVAQAGQLILEQLLPTGCKHSAVVVAVAAARAQKLAQAAAAAALVALAPLAELRTRRVAALVRRRSRHRTPALVAYAL